MALCLGAKALSIRGPSPLRFYGGHASWHYGGVCGIFLWGPCLLPLGRRMWRFLGAMLQEPCSPLFARHFGPFSMGAMPHHHQGGVYGAFLGAMPPTFKGALLPAVFGPFWSLIYGGHASHP